MSRRNRPPSAVRRATTEVKDLDDQHAVGSSLPVVVRVRAAEVKLTFIQKERSSDAFSSSSRVAAFLSCVVEGILE